jgi:antitoxin component YwqK of YwqJK toxin-antitoxin module
MRFLFLFVVLLSVYTLSGQQDTIVYYFHKNGNPCPKEYASSQGYGIRDKEGIRVIHYDIEKKQVIMSGHYTDSTLTIKDGLFQYYNKEGLMESVGHYRNNQREGWWAYWISLANNNPTDSIFYENGKDISSISLNYHSNDQLSTRILNNPRNKIKEYSQWSFEGSLLSKAIWTNNTGDQVDYYPKGEVKAITTYVKGKVAEKKYFRPDGSEVSEKEVKKEQEKAEKEFRNMMESLMPVFTGGKDGFRSWLNKNFHIPPNIRDMVYAMQTITIVFYLDEKGRPYNLSVIESNNSYLLEAVNRFFRDLPSWDMKGHKQFGPISISINLR